jgi:hypothetical protein
MRKGDSILAAGGEIAAAVMAGRDVMVLLFGLLGQGF